MTNVLQQLILAYMLVPGLVVYAGHHPCHDSSDDASAGDDHELLHVLQSVSCTIVTCIALYSANCTTSYRARSKKCYI